MVGIITTANVVYYKNLSAGEVHVIPRGLVHFQMNVGVDKVVAFSAFNSQLPGSIQIPRALFASSNASSPVPDQVLIKAFQVNRTVIDEIRSNLSK